MTFPFPWPTSGHKKTQCPRTRALGLLGCQTKTGSRRSATTNRIPGSFRSTHARGTRHNTSRSQAGLLAYGERADGEKTAVIPHPATPSHPCRRASYAPLSHGQWQEWPVLRSQRRVRGGFAPPSLFIPLMAETRDRAPIHLSGGHHTRPQADVKHLLSPNFNIRAGLARRYTPDRFVTRR